MVGSGTAQHHSGLEGTNGGAERTLLRLLEEICQEWFEVVFPLGLEIGPRTAWAGSS